jgi:hypothetical protein
VSGDRIRRLLDRVEIPGEHEGRERAWQVVRAAYAEREPVPRPRRRLIPAVAFAVFAAIVAAAFTPPGRAVVETVRKAVGIESAEPALFSLPSPGRLLVVSDAGPWIVGRDGSKRLLGPWGDAAWSPNGLFVAAARPNELAALEPDGTVRWKLARRDVLFPRWGGTRTDTRIAYLSGSRLHVVAGDGTGDVDAGGLPAAARLAPAWRPGSPHVFAYVTTRGRVYVYEPDAGALRWRSAPFPNARKLVWSPDGSRLLLVAGGRLALFAAGRAEPLAVRRLAGVVDAAFAPGGRRVAVLRGRDVLLLDAADLGGGDRPVFAGAGTFGQVAWSPNGRWLLVSWPDADQWVFVRPSGEIAAVSNVAMQFEGTFPTVAGWCCPGP